MCSAFVSLKIKPAASGLRLASVRLCQRLFFVLFLSLLTSKRFECINTVRHSYGCLIRLNCDITSFSYQTFWAGRFEPLDKNIIMLKCASAQPGPWGQGCNDSHQTITYRHHVVIRCRRKWVCESENYFASLNSRRLDVCCDAFTRHTC